MSIRVMTYVWQHSRAKNGARLVLLALADFADDGGGCYPSISSLVKKTLLAERSVQVALKELVDLGELFIRANEARNSCNYYIINLTPADSAPPQNPHPAETTPPQNLREGGAESAPKPSGNRQEISEAIASSPAAAGPKPKCEKNPALLKEIAGLFHQHCPTLPRIQKIEGARLKAVRARWRTAGEQPVVWFERLFRAAGGSDFLNGNNGWAGCSFDWLMSPQNSQKVLEGNYSNERQRAPRSPPGTRPFLNAAGIADADKPASELRAVPF